MHLNTQWNKKENIREISKYLEMNKNEKITYHNLWDSAKAVLRGKIIAINTYIKNKKDFQSAT